MQSTLALAADCVVSGSRFFDFASQLGSNVRAERLSETGNCYTLNNTMLASSSADSPTVCEFSLFNALQMDESSSFDKFLYTGEGFTILEGPERGGRSLALKIKVEADASATRSVSITRVELSVDDCGEWKEAF